MTNNFKNISVNRYSLPLILFFILTIIGLVYGCAESSQEESKKIYGSVDAKRSARFNLQLGLGYLEQGDVERAKGKFLKALQQAPDMPEVHYNIAHFYYLIDENHSADQHFNQAIKYANKSSKGVLGAAHNNYGVFLCQVKKFKLADEHFKLAINDMHYADTASAYENAGLCALKTNNQSEAKLYFENAIKKNPLSVKALIEISELYVKDNELDKAKLYLDRYNQLSSPSQRSVLLDLKIAKLQNDTSKINELTQVILKKYPDTKNWLNESQNYSQVDKSDYNNKLVKYTEIGELINIA